MSSIIEEIDSSARINSAVNDDKSYKCKKVHTNQKDKLLNFASHEILQSNDVTSGGSKDCLGNFNCNNGTEISNDTYLSSILSDSSSRQYESNDEISKNLSQFTFLDNNVPSQQDFTITGNSESSASSFMFLAATHKKNSISNAIPGDTINDKPYIPKHCENDKHFMVFNNFNEKKDKEKLSDKPKHEESKKNGGVEEESIEYIVYESELQMPQIMKLITNDLSEPYSIYTYRYFIHNWPKLCFLAMCGEKCVGVIVCKLDYHKKVIKRGYIAMLAVDKDQRRKGIGSNLVVRAIQSMVADNCDEVVLETEITNKGALHLYENLGFVRDKRLFRYYLNGVDALRLKLWLK